MDSLRRKCIIDSLDMSERPPVIYAVDCNDGLHEVPYYLGDYNFLLAISRAQQKRVPLMLFFDGHAPYSTIVGIG